MKKKVEFKNSIQKKYLNKKLTNQLLLNYKKIIKEILFNIDNLKSTESILSDKFTFNFKFNELKKFKRYNRIAIIGMGGSVLGAEAIHEFLAQKIKKKVYFFNDIDVRKIFDFKKKKISKKTLFIVISKSGNTIETISNFLSLGIIKKNQKNIILISEKKDNVLFSISKKYNLFFIQHKENIGGRFSVLSEVGMVPAYLMGLNINRIRSNLKYFLLPKNEKVLKENSLKISNIFLKRKISNLIFLNYSPILEKYLFWYQQLIAESLGKKGKGFLPVVSKVPKDHHSLLQLYLDGPNDKLFFIFSAADKFDMTVYSKKISNKINYLNAKSLKEIKLSQKKALIKSFKKYKIPFREIEINTLEEETLGTLFAYSILETIIIGKLSQLNPFDQPAVEQVKKFTKQILR